MPLRDKPESEKANSSKASNETESHAYLGTLSVAEFVEVAANMPAKTIHFDIRPEDRATFDALLVK